MSLVSDKNSESPTWRFKLLHYKHLYKILWILGLFVFIIGVSQIFIKVFSYSDPTISEKYSSFSLNSVPDPDPPLPFLNQADLKHLKLWDKITMYKLLPPKSLKSILGIIYWGSIISYNCPTTSSKPELISIIPSFTDYIPFDISWDHLNKFQNGDKIFLKERLYFENLNCTQTNILSIPHINQLTIIKTEFKFNQNTNLFTSNPSLELSTDYPLPPDHFRKNWIVLPDDEVGCVEYFKLEQSQNIITEKSKMMIQLLPTPDDNPFEIHLREPTIKCFSATGRRTIYWSQKGYFYTLQYNGSIKKQKIIKKNLTDNQFNIYD